MDAISFLKPINVSGSDLTHSASSKDLSNGVDFSKVMNDVIQSAAQSVKAGESAAISGLRGQLPLQDVVEAVMSAERSLQTALALRDKSVAAWQEISRMSI